MSDFPAQISSTALQKLIFDRHKARHVLAERKPLGEPTVERVAMLDDLLRWIAEEHLLLTDKELRTVLSAIERLYNYSQNTKRD